MMYKGSPHARQKCRQRHFRNSAFRPSPTLRAAGTLFKDEVYGPILLQDENGVAHGNDWARGFMRGMGMRHDGWADLVNDEEHGGCLIPMMMLCHEHDEDPEMRPKPISPEQREDVIVHMAAGLLGAYRYPPSMAVG
jgi:uncharacterized protein